MIIPLEDREPEARDESFHLTASEGEGLREGDLVRLIREPHFGVIARVKGFPSELQTIPTESRVRVLVAELPNGQNITVPRANVEIIEG